MEENQENNQEVENKDQRIVELEEYIKNLTFFSDQTSFNATIHQALKLILQKLAKIEEKLDKKQDGNNI